MNKDEEKQIQSLLSIIVAIIFFIFLVIVYILYSTKRNVEILNFTATTEVETKPTPSQLRWHDNFKGIDNMKNNKPVQKEEEKPKSFFK